LLRACAAVAHYSLRIAFKLFASAFLKKVVSPGEFFLAAVVMQ